MIKSIEDEKNKIIKSFLVIGLNENLIQKYDENEKSLCFIQNADILIKDLPYNYQPSNKDEKWISLIKEKNAWLRLKYSNEYNCPITDLLIVDCDYESPEYILLEKKYIDEQYKPIMVSIYKEEENKEKKVDDESYPIINEFDLYTPYSDVYLKIPSHLNVKEILKIPTQSKCSVLLISRKYSSLPLKDITIIKKKDLFNLGIARNKSPYLYKYIPEILDQYPPSEENNSSVSMFCFPNGLKIEDQFKMPNWFTFVLTDELGERTYGSTLIFWEDLDNKIKENFIPYYDDNKNIKNKKYYFIPKAICILSKFPFYHNCRLFLKQLYRIQTSSKSLIPLERAISSFVNTLYIQSNQITQFIINEEKLNFYRIPNYGELWDTKNTYLEVLFHVLSFNQIIIAWQGLLLEKKLFLLCSSKATLSCVAHALINLLFPFKWVHVYVPILPEKLKLFIDSPVPLIIGISFPVDLNDFPSDALILNINKNKFENYVNPVPKLRGKLQAVLEKKLRNLKEEYNFINTKDSQKWMDFQDEVTPSFELDDYNRIDTSKIRDVFYNVFISMFKNYNKYIDWDEINKYLNNNNQDDEEDITQKIFKKKYFLKDHSCEDENDFISLFCETNLFNQFLETFLKIKAQKLDGPMAYFLESIKKGKPDKKVYLPKIIPEQVIILPEIYIKDLKGQTFYYKIFPTKLTNSLYISFEKPKKPFKSKFQKYIDEWCYQINKIKKKDWPKYLLYLIYEIWFHFFSFIIHFYGDNESILLMNYSLFLLEDLIDNKKIIPTRNLFCKLFKSCGRDVLSIFVKKILLLVNKIYKNSKYSNIFHNSYLSGLYSLTESLGPNSTIALPSTNSYLNITAIRTNILNEICSDDNDTKTIIENYLFIDSKICPNCIINKKKLKKINPMLILAGFNFDENKSYIICPECLAKIEPYIYYLKKSKPNLKTYRFKLIPPHKLIRDIDELINREGEIFFYKRIKADNLAYFLNLYLSIIFYFQLFDLPLFVLYIPKNNYINLINELNEEIQNNKLRKMTKKEKKKSGKSISPDRANKSREKSLDNKSGISGDLTDVSRKSTFSNVSELENEIWQNIQINSKNDEIYYSNEKINSNEKNEYLSRIKDMKNIFTGIIQYFISNNKEKMEIFLNKISEKQENVIGLGLKKENEKERHNNLSNNNLMSYNIKINLDKKYDSRNIKTNINKIKLEVNEKEIKEDKEENKYNDNIEKNNMSFSGIIEIGDEEEKNKNNNNKKNDKILNVIEEEDDMDINIQKEINNKSNKNLSKFNNIDNFSEINCDDKKNGNKQKEIYKKQKTFDKSENNIYSDEKIITEFDYKDKQIYNKNIEKSSITEHSLKKDNNITTSITNSNTNDTLENRGTNKNLNTGVKKKKKIKIYSENFFE